MTLEMFKKIVSLALISSMLTLSSVNYAQQAYPSIASIASIPVPKLELNEQSVGTAVSPIKKNQKAPFTGVLFSPEAVSSIIITYKTFPDTIKLEVTNAVQICQIKNDKTIADQKSEAVLTNSINQSQITTLSTENESLKKIADEYAKQSSISPTIWIGIGFVGGVILTSGIVYVATRGSN